MSKSVDGEMLFSGLDLNVNKGDKIALISKNSLATTALYEILNGNDNADTGEFAFGQTITTGYLPTDNEHFFETDLSLMDWLAQFTKSEDDVFHPWLSWQDVVFG